MFKIFSIFSALVSLVLVFGGLVGCSSINSPKLPSRSKKKDGLPPALSIPDAVQTSLASGETLFVGDVARFANTQGVEIYGFGLVRGLAGTGSFEREGVDRGMVLRDMQRREIPQAMDILRSPTTAVVRITAVVPAGASVGDVIDIKLDVPPDSETTSLRGGTLLEATLQDAGILEGKFLEGKSIALAEGPVFLPPKTSLENTDFSPGNLKDGVVLGGAVLRQPRIVHIIVKDEFQSVFVTERIAREVNHRFILPGKDNQGVATAKDEVLVALEIPPMYVRNIPRYLRVIRAVVLYDSESKRQVRLERLKSEILDPAKTESASYQLEAMGATGIPVLRTALESDVTEVRFYAAVALAYLNDHTASRPLVDLATSDSAFRPFALDALGVVKDPLDAEELLREMLHNPRPEVRYSALRALLRRHGSTSDLRGEVLGGQFRYHVVPSSTPPLVHVRKTHRPEIVLFGQDIRLVPPFALSAGPTLVVTSKGADTVVVSKFVVRGADESRMVSTRLDDIIRAVAELGGTYGDVLQMLGEAVTQQSLRCQLETDVTPGIDLGGIYRSQHTEEPDTAPAIVAAKPSFWQKMNPLRTTDEKSPKKTHEKSIEDNVNRSARE